MSEIKQKKINWFDKEKIVACDGLCNKAWGGSTRPRIFFDKKDPDDMAFYADQELGEAPDDPGTTEGFCGKPDKTTIGAGEGMNRWCTRQCERSKIFAPGEPIVLDDFTQRQYNQPWKHGKS